MKLKNTAFTLLILLTATQLGAMDNQRFDRKRSTPYGQQESNQALWNGEALIKAAYQGNNAELTKLLNLGVNPNFVSPRGKVALLLAAGLGHTSTVSLLLTHNADVTITDNNGKTALHWAAGNGHIDTVNALLAALPDANQRAQYINYQDASGTRALFWAVMHNHKLVINTLLSNGAQDIKNHEGSNALSAASFTGNTQVVTTLLAAIPAAYDRVRYINTPNKKGKTALSLAAGKGHASVVSLLLAQGAQDIPDENGKTAHSWATTNGYPQIASLITTPQKESTTETPQATVNVPSSQTLPDTPDLTMLPSLSTNKVIQEEKNNDQTQANGEALINAAGGGKNAEVKNLLGLGVDPNFVSPSGKAALILAAGFGRTSTVSLLLAAGADVTITDGKKKTALSWAAGYGEADVVSALLNSISDVDKRAHYINHQDRNGLTALYWAAKNNHSDILNTLLNNGAHDMHDHEGKMVLSYAASAGNTDIVRALLSAVQNPKELTQYINHHDRDGWTALHCAANNGHAITASTLLAYKALDISYNDGKTALHLAAKNGHTNTVITLVTAITDAHQRIQYVNQQNKYGDTAIHYAAHNGHIAAVSILLHYGALNILNHEGKTAYDYALTKNYWDITNLLSAHYWAAATMNTAIPNAQPAQTHPIQNLPTYPGTAVPRTERETSEAIKKQHSGQY